MDVRNNEMDKLYASSFSRIESGSVLKGTVVCVNKDGVMVDIGYKSEGFIPAGEFPPEEFAGLKAGDSVDAYVVRVQSSEGIVTLSKERAVRIKTWDVIEDAFNKGAVMQGRITAKINGGLSVDIQGVKAFMPASQAGSSIRDFDSLIGQTVNLRVLKLNSRLSNVVVSCKAVMEEDRERKKMEMLPRLKEGACLDGIVKNITDYGVFVDLHGMDGLLHISDISWGRITHPSEYFALGDKVQVIVLRYDEASGRITLGYKQKKPDPWLSAHEKYKAGEKVSGRVASIADYGAFIELEEGIEGLVHVSEIDWSSRPKHPSKYLSVGETVEAVVLKADSNERRISLSMKQLKPSPWEDVSMKYTVGQRITGKVKSFTEFGTFVELPEGVDGLIHISDISWTRHIKHPSEILKRGQKIDAVILAIEPEKERVALGLKQLASDPWVKEIPGKFKPGDDVDCRVLRITDFGIFVEMEGGVEGLIYLSEVIKGEDPLKEGDKICASIIKVDAEGRKIGLSMKHTDSGEAL